MYITFQYFVIFFFLNISSLLKKIPSTYVFNFILRLSPLYFLRVHWLLPASDGSLTPVSGTAVVTLAATSARWAPADTHRVQTYNAHAVCFSLVSMAVLLTPRLQIPWDPDWH